MLIDWFTVGAQVLNFLLLVWALKHFLYQPILHAIDEREKRIARQLADAEAQQAQAQKDRADFEHKNEQFDQERAALLSKATDEAKAERERLDEEARKSAEAKASKRDEAVRSEAQNLSQAIARRTQAEVFAITRKALTDLATTSLEERMAEVFARRLRELPADRKTDLARALQSAAEPALLRSTFELPPEQRAALQNALNVAFSAEVRVKYETAPDLVCGIELSCNGQKVAWSIANYLKSLEKSVSELLKEGATVEAPSKQSKPEPLHAQNGSA